MSYKVTVEGVESFEIAKECVRSVKFTTDIPLDSNARTKDVGSTLTITGRILTAVDGDPFDSTRKLALWSAEKGQVKHDYSGRRISGHLKHRAGGASMGRVYPFSFFILHYFAAFLTLLNGMTLVQREGKYNHKGE